MNEHFHIYNGVYKQEEEVSFHVTQKMKNVNVRRKCNKNFFFPPSSDDYITNNNNTEKKPLVKESRTVVCDLHQQSHIKTIYMTTPCGKNKR